MASTIKLKISVDDSGSLKVVAKEAGKAASATDKLVNSTDKLNNKRSKYHKTEKGVAGATSNSTKSFAKQAQAIGGGSSGLVGAYATLAAHVFAVSAAFGVLQRNAGFKQLEQGIIFTGRAAGANLPLVSKNLKEITDNAISTADAMKAVAIGTSAGFSSDQLEGLTKVAKGASLALGRDMTDAMDRLVRGAAKLEPEILDELGIMVRLDKTAQDFAGTIGKSADELTVFEKRMAFTNAIIDQGQKKFGALNGVIEANPYSKLAAQFDSLIKGTIGAIDTVLGPAIGAIAGSMGMLIGVMGIFATGVVKMMVPALNQGGAAAAAMAKNTAGAAKAQLASTKTFKDAPKVFNELQKKMVAGTATSQDMTKAQTSLTQSVALHRRQMPGYIKSHGESSKAVAVKKSKLDAAKLALDSLTRSQHLETQATLQAARADVLNTASSNGLIATYKALTAQIMIETAAVKASNLSKTTGAAIANTFKMSLNLAMFSVKAFGLALVNAIPVIGQIIFFASMAISVFKKFFSSKPTVLEKQFEKTKEVLKDFPNVISQMIDSYSMAADSSQRFEISLKAQAGLIGQVSSQMKAQMGVQRTALIIEQARAKAAFEKQKIINKSRMAKEKHSGGGQTGARKENTRDLKTASAAVATANAKTPDFDLALDNQIVIMAEAITMQQAMASATKAGSNENKLANEHLKETTRIFDLLVNGGMGPDEAAKAYQKLELSVGNTLETFQASTDLVANSNKRMMEASKPVGSYSEQITELGTTISALEGQMDNPEVVARYADIFKNFKVEEGDLESLKQLEVRLRALNMLATNAPVLASQQKLEGAQKAKAGATTSQLLKDDMGASQSRQGIAQANLDSADSVNMSASERAGYSTTVNNELLNQNKIDSQMEANRVSEATRLGGAGFGAGTQVGETVQNIKGTLDNPDVEKSAKIKMMSDAISPMTEQLKSMGPEGEAMGMAIEGAALLGETLTSAFEGGKMSAKEGLAATAAALSAVSGIMKAQTKMRVAGIDKEIKAERARDGKSKESLDKIKKLEKKKDDMKRKSFEKQKKMQIAQTVISTVSAVMAVMDDVPTPFNFILAGLVGAMGAMQIATIRKQTYDGGGGGGGSPAKKPSSVSMGERGGSVDLANSSSGAVGELGYARGKDGVGGINNFKPAFTGARYRASGGSAGYIVGEQGPELFMPDTPGNIVSAGDTAAGGGSSNVNISISAIDAAGVEDVLQAQRANIIGMIRESANQVGETFLENVDTISEGARY